MTNFLSNENPLSEREFYKRFEHTADELQNTVVDVVDDDPPIIDKDIINRAIKMRLSELLTMSLTSEIVRDLCDNLTNDIYDICGKAVDAWSIEYWRDFR